MNLFDPRTYSTDWEVMVVDKLNRCVDDEKLVGFAGVLRSELDLPVQADWNSLEFALGVNSSFDQFWDRIQKVTDRASQLVREFDLDLFPAGSHPVEPMYNCSHIHVGTVHDETTGIYLENRMMRYIPVFAALAANSPAAHGMRSGFKSYRVRDTAYWCIVPSESRDPHMAQSAWDRDIVSKIYGAPTMEVRIPDCASSRRLLAEFATFIAAYTHYQGTKVVEYLTSPSEYREYLTNRWAASRYGLQATFNRGGTAKPVVEMLDEMLDECQAELEILGVRRSDLAVINTMIEKRICQSDFVLSFAGRYPDDYCLASVWAKLVRHWDIFEQYLESAAALDPVPIVDEDAVMAEHLAFVGEGTHFYRLRDAMWYPSPAAAEIIERMIEQRIIRREITPNRGMLLHRNE